MDFFQLVSEDKIRKAYNDGEFDQLPGFGQPLKLEDLSCLPEELRMGYKLLKNAGMVSEEATIKKELLTIEQLIEACEDGVQLVTLQQKLTEKQLRLNQLFKKRHNTPSSLFKEYQKQIEGKLK